MASVTGELRDAGFDLQHVTTAVSEPGGTVRVGLTYDGSGDGFLRVGVVPLPSTTIRRVAAVRLGGL